MNVGKDTKVLLMQKYFNTDYFLQEEKESSKQVNLINNYSHIFASETLMQSLRLASDSIVMLVILVLLFSTSIIYAFSFLILFTFILLAYGLFVKEKIKNYGKVSTKSAGDVIELVQNSIDGRQELKVYQKENIMLYYINYQ